MSEHISKVLSVSAVHVKPSTFNLMVADDIQNLACFQKPNPKDHNVIDGVFVYIGGVDLDEDSEDAQNIPQDLLQVLRYADCFDVSWIIFDVDYDEIGELHRYQTLWDKAAMGIVEG